MSKAKKDEAPYIPLGKILGPWGLKGELKFQLYNPASEVMFQTRQVFRKAGFSFQEVSLFSVKRHGKFLRIHVEGVNSPEAARVLMGEEFFIPQVILPPKEQEEFYAFELVGLEVLSTQGERLGQVKEVVSYGASEILVVKDPRNGKEIMVPLISDFVKTISLEEKKVVVEGVEDLV